MFWGRSRLGLRQLQGRPRGEESEGRPHLCARCWPEQRERRVTEALGEAVRGMVERQVSRLPWGDSPFPRHFSARAGSQKGRSLSHLPGGAFESHRVRELWTETRPLHWSRSGVGQDVDQDAAMLLGLRGPAGKGVRGPRVSPRACGSLPATWLPLTPCLCTE